MATALTNLPHQPEWLRQIMSFPQPNLLQSSHSHYIQAYCITVATSTADGGPWREVKEHNGKQLRHSVSYSEQICALTFVFTSGIELVCMASYYLSLV